VGYNSRCPCYDQPSTFVTSPGPNVNDPVTARHYVHIVLDNDYRVTRIDQSIQLLHQLAHIAGVEPCGRLIQYIQALAAVRTLQLGGKLNTLCLAARKLRCRLT
jgi:hypothetical protein